MKELFDLSIHKLDYGFTRIRLHLRWPVGLFELCQQLRLLCRYKHFQDQNPKLYSGSLAPRTVSTSCYVHVHVRDKDEYNVYKKSFFVFTKQSRNKNLFAFTRDGVKRVNNRSKLAVQFTRLTFYATLFAIRLQKGF